MHVITKLVASCASFHAYGAYVIEGGQRGRAARLGASNRFIRRDLISVQWQLWAIHIPKTGRMNLRAEGRKEGRKERRKERRERG
jgi:hypothetical protein